MNWLLKNRSNLDMEKYCVQSWQEMGVVVEGDRLVEMEWGRAFQTKVMACVGAWRWKYMREY